MNEGAVICVAAIDGMSAIAPIATKSMRRSN
jgi:hypothetical protein